MNTHTTHIFIADHESALDALTQAYGDRLEKLNETQKLFISSSLSLYLLGLYSLGGAIDELDPEAQYPANFLKLVEGLEKHSRHDLLSLIATIAMQLAWIND